MNNEVNRIFMSLDFGIKRSCYSFIFGKQELIEEDILVKDIYEIRIIDVLGSLKGIDLFGSVKMIEKRLEFLFFCKRFDLLYLVSERRRKVGVVRQLDFKDDMVVDLIDSS